MHALLDWIEKNPVLFSVVLWPIVTAILTAAFAKPTPEFTAKYPRIAGLRMLISDMGFNLPKFLDNVRLALTGKASDGKAPSVPPLPLLLCIWIVGIIACGPPQASAQPIDKTAALCISHRTAKELACVDIYNTRPEIDACRAKVKADLDCTKDAGTLDAGDAE